MRNLSLILLRAAFVLGSLFSFFYFANLSFYHSWAGGSPAGLHSTKELLEWHEYWAEFFQNVAFLSITLLVLFIGYHLYLYLRKSRQTI
jgi:hypothetical protein